MESSCVILGHVRLSYGCVHMCGAPADGLCGNANRCGSRIDRVERAVGVISVSCLHDV